MVVIFHSAAVKGFGSTSEMIDAIWSECGNKSYSPVAGGVSFEGLPSPDSPIPNNIKYGLHMYTAVPSGMSVGLLGYVAYTLLAGQISISLWYSITAE